MIKINLLSEGKRPVVARRARQPVGGQADFGNAAMIGGIVIGLLVAFGWWFMLDRDIKKKDGEIAVAQKEVDELAQVIKEVEDYKVKSAELKRKIDVINDLKANQRGPVRIMDDISRTLPELLWLSRMNVTAAQIQLQGTAFNMSAVANFLDNLDKIEEFSEPILADATQKSAKAGSRNETYDFKINVGYSFAARKAADAIETGAASESPGAAVAKAGATRAATESEAE